MPGGHDLAAFGDPLDPVRETVGVVLRAYDVAGAHDEAPAAVDVVHGPLTERLEGAVGLVGDLFGPLVVEGGQWSVLVEPYGAEIGVDGFRGDERVVLRLVGEELRRRPDDPGDVARDVDNPVKGASLEGV